jgi:hypothetical protein
LRGTDLGAYSRQRGDRRSGVAEVGGGRRWKPCSGELAAWPGQQVKGKLRGVLGEVGAAHDGGANGRSQGFTVGTKTAAMAAW